MPRIIVRYLNREIINTMLIITAILLAILICNQFVRYLGDAVMGRMTAKSVMQMMSIQVPLLAGFLFDHFGSKVPFLCASTLFALSFLTCLSFASTWKPALQIKAAS